MGARGPAPISPQLRALRGTDRADRGQSPTGRGTGKRPAMPKGLPLAAAAEWRRATRLLARFEILSEMDQRALADYCLCCVRLDQAEALITEHGLLVRGDRGLVKNPACQLARQYRAELRQWCAAFGMTPGARGRMNLPTEPVDHSDPFEDFLSNRGRGSA